MKKVLCASMLMGSLFGAAPAHAVDGCKVMLCIAGNWQNIAVCRPEVEEAMREVERGHGWPQCSEAPNMGLEWTTEATCPPFYARYGGDSGGYMGCTYGAVVRTKVNGAPWADMFWAPGTTSTSTKYYPPARTALGANTDPRYDTDAAQYVPPTAPPPCNRGDSC